MKYMKDQRHLIWGEIVCLINLNQLTQTMGDDFRTWVTKAEKVKEVSKSKKVHALADKLLKECSRISKEFTWFQGFPFEKTSLVKELIHAHVIAVQEYDHDSVEEIEEYLFDLKFAPTKEDLKSGDV